MIVLLTNKLHRKMFDDDQMQAKKIYPKCLQLAQTAIARLKVYLRNETIEKNDSEIAKKVNEINLLFRIF